MTAEARQDKIFDIFKTIEEWLKNKTKYEAVDILRKYDIPCAPVFSMKELAESPDLRKSGSIVEVDHKVRGKYLTIGRPIKFSDLEIEVKPSPVLVETTHEVLRDLGYGKKELGSQLLKGPAIQKDGRTLSIAFSVAMLFDENHKVTGVAAVIRDETARWLEERELKQRLASYEAKSASVSQTASPGNAKT